MMQRGVYALTLTAPLVAASELRGMRESKVGRMQPDVAAGTFAKVENKWFEDAYAFVRCEDGCEDIFNTFDHSCKSLAETIVQASSGDRGAVKEYMSDICNEPALQDKNRARCQTFAQGLTAAMSIDSSVNRDKVYLDRNCADLWSTLRAEGQASVDAEKKEAEERAAADKKAAEERAAAEKKVAEERAVAEKKAEEERAAAEKKAAEERAATEKKAAEEHAAAEKKAAEKAATEKKAAEEAAAAKKKAAEEAAAKKASELAAAEKKATEEAAAERKEEAAAAAKKATEEAAAEKKAAEEVAAETKKSEVEAAKQQESANLADLGNATSNHSAVEAINTTAEAVNTTASK